MCLSPNSIPNPNFGRKCLSSYKDITSRFIRVPCGYCSECIHTKQISIVQRMRMESKMNHLFFCTLTYRNECLPCVQLSNGRSVRYAKIKDVQDMVKRLRKCNAFSRPFRYFAVSELGSKGARPHFHIIWIVPKYDGDDYNTCLSLERLLFDAVLSEWRRNIGTIRHPLYQSLCTYVRRYVRGRLSTTYDLHYIRSFGNVADSDNVFFYVIKYMLKPSDRAIKLQRALRLNLPEDEYLSVWNMVKPRTFKSIDFGLSRNSEIQKLLRGYVHKSYDLDFPTFFNPDGSTWPLSKFYKSKGDIFSVADAVHFFRNDVPDDKNLTQQIQSVKKYEKQVQISDSRGSALDFDELFDSKSDSCQSLE